MRVLSSGSCRLLTSLARASVDDVEGFNFMMENFFGPHFLGKLHSAPQHLQFIKFLNEEIDIPKELIPWVFTTYTKHETVPYGKQNGEASLTALRAAIKSIDVFIFEVCTLKTFMIDGVYLHSEFIETSPYLPKPLHIQSQGKEDIVKTLLELCAMTNGKPVILLSHFRPQVYYPGEQSISARETLFEAMNDIAVKMPNVHVLDPSEWIRIQTPGRVLSDSTHFSDIGLAGWGKEVLNFAHNLLTTTGGEE